MENKKLDIKRNYFEAKVLPKANVKNMGKFDVDPVDVGLDQTDNIPKLDNKADAVAEPDFRQVNSKRRPNRHRLVKYTKYGNNKIETGWVHGVGKASGKEKNICWMKGNYDIIQKVDFVEEVEKWQYVDLATNITFGDDVQNTFAVLIPTKRHLEPECVMAKQEELSKWDTFGAFEIVQDEGGDKETEDKEKVGVVESDMEEVVKIDLGEALEDKKKF